MFHHRLSHRVGRSSQAMTAAVEKSHHSLTHRIQDTPAAYPTTGQPNSNVRTVAPLLSTSFRLLVAASFLIAASILQASDWFKQANLTSRRLGGLVRV